MIIFVTVLIFIDAIIKFIDAFDYILV